MFTKILLWVLLIAPWFTLFLLKKEDIKRYMPAAIFATLLMIIYNIIAANQHHWELNIRLISWLKPLFTSGIFGAFPVITIWIFYFTYQRFWIYLLTNIILDFMFAVFPVHYLLQDVLGIYHLETTTTWERFIIFVVESVIIYGYFKWQEGIFQYKQS
ncbi:hypothetical protein OEV98_16740 [Caldibacillus lycopersici]|uniref:Uncharacterized protein n=1 Tax=Perspicuibacillus lycopersici TaxID=1325689 RepID=A0AAE3LPP7_9BACI|nr:hypothetical protein [Perspicuibacillus lycopersici]MCU9615177.1 hypothetical protein [Perspicuibacillus lycopersici]